MFLLYLFRLFKKEIIINKKKEIKGHDSGNENLSSETTKDFAVGIEVQTALEHELTTPQVIGVPTNSKVISTPC